MTDLQKLLIAVLSSRKINAKWAGDTLEVSAVFKRATGKKQRCGARIVFDSAAALDGARAVGFFGTYGEAIGRQTFFECLRIGSGESAALAHVTECRRVGVSSGAPQSFLDANPEPVSD